MQVRRQQLELDMEQQTGSESGKQYVTAVYWSPCLFKFCGVYHEKRCGAGGSTSWNQIVGRNINNLKYADDTTIMAESKEELKSLLMRVKRRVKKLA